MMGLLLIAQRRETTLSLSCSWQTWNLLLHIGRQHGWQPAGTIHNSRPDWHGSYYSNDGQTVTAADSRAWAAALRRAVAAATADRAFHTALSRCARSESHANHDAEASMSAAAGVEPTGEHTVAHVLSAIQGEPPDPRTQRIFLATRAAVIDSFIRLAESGAFSIQ